MNLPEQLLLKQMELGPLNNFLYFLGDKNTNQIAVIDPAWDVDYLSHEITKNGFQVQSVFLTHAHPDHVNGLDEFLSRYDVPAYLSKHEYSGYRPHHPNIKDIDDGDQLSIGTMNFDVFATPGHSPGCVSFCYQNVAITGDCIFIDGCGRCDLPGSDPAQQYHTLYNVIMNWPDDTLLFTGHNYGPKAVDTLAAQKQTNPYLTCHSKEEFLQARMGL